MLLLSDLPASVHCLIQLPISHAGMLRCTGRVFRDRNETMQAALNALFSTRDHSIDVMEAAAKRYITGEVDEDELDNEKAVILAGFVMHSLQISNAIPILERYDSVAYVMDMLRNRSKALLGSKRGRDAIVRYLESRIEWASKNHDGTILEMRRVFYGRIARWLRETHVLCSDGSVGI